VRVRIVTLLLLATIQVLSASENWPQFRGPNGDGTSDSHSLPLFWSEQTNITWKTPIPGEGWSSPVVEGNQIWMQTALDHGKSLRAVSVDRANGKVQHDIELFHVENPERKHALNSFASPTAVIENGLVYFSFGMYGMACLEAATCKILWTNTELKHDHDKNGPGSSPIIYGDLFIINCDGTEARFVAALNKFTGKLAWRTDRSNVINRTPEFKKAYHTPLIINVNGRDQLISMGAFRVSAYEPLTGREIWWVDIPGFSNVPMPVFGHAMIYLATGFMKPELWAIRADGYGDVTRTHVAWKFTKQAPAKPSPLLVGEQLYLLADTGIVSCLDARSGKEIWAERIPGEYSASPVLADGRIYCFSQQGQAVVLKPGTKLNTLATNSLDDGFMASPAIAGKSFFLRTKKNLYRIDG